MAAMGEPCSSDPNCSGDFDRFLFDGRVPTIDVEKSDVWLAIVPVPPELSRADVWSMVDACTLTLHHAGAPPPIHLLNCVFLN